MRLTHGYRHWYRLWRDPAYRLKSAECAALRTLPRYQRAVSRLLGPPCELVDAPSFLGMYEEIFEREVFRFDAGGDRPYIIDGGANIGLATIYFKRLYPRSRIVAFEPDPDVFAVLQRNVQTFALTDVELHRQGLWSSEQTVGFMHEGADGGRIAHISDRTDAIVPTVRLRDFLDRPVDFLKLDIEGAEPDVLADSRDLLHRVAHLFVEYHSFADEPQRLHEILGLLDEAGFRVHLDAWQPAPRPFVQRQCNMGFDMQVNIFGYRPAAGVRAGETIEAGAAAACAR